MKAETPSQDKPMRGILEVSGKYYIELGSSVVSALKLRIGDLLTQKVRLEDGTIEMRRHEIE
jgi:hypothetical protein